MTSANLVLSLGEIFFYFTRAATGVGVPFGLAEDFGRASAWIGGSGLDPAQITVAALNALDEGQSDLCANLIESDGAMLLTSLTDKPLSALQAGPAVCDWISSQTKISRETRRFVARNVDSPFLVVAALGVVNCGCWEASWRDAGGNQYLVFMAVDGGWKASWSGSETPQQSGSAEMTITQTLKASSDSEEWPHHGNTSGKNRIQVLESGTPVYEEWPRIYAFFSRCLVPSTQQSRQAGAGAGLVNTD